MALVLGEASESDEDICNENYILKPAVFATETLGEATESDEDMNGNSNEVKKPMNIFNVNNLLQRKLIDANVSLWNNLPRLIKNVLNAASKEVLYTDQLVTKSQVSIQSAISLLKKSRANIKQLHNKLDNIFSTSFLPKFISTNKSLRNSD